MTNGSDSVLGDPRLSQVFANDPVPPALALPGRSAAAQQRLRDIADENRRMPGEPEPVRVGFSKADEARARAVAEYLVRMLQNTNLTASLPAHTTPDPRAIWWDQSATVTVPGAVSAAWTTVITYKVPANRWLTVRGYGVDVDGSYTYNGSLLWRIAVEGIPVPNLGSWGEHRGTVPRPRDTSLLVKQDQTVTFDVRRAVIAGAPSTVAMALNGWLWVGRNSYEGARASVSTF